MFLICRVHSVVPAWKLLVSTGPPNLLWSPPDQAHLVAAFEQSLGNMTIRLKSLTLTAEQKVKTAPLIYVQHSQLNQSAHSLSRQ